MLDTAGKTAKKNYNKIGTEDDPVIIAQRFLNIFRQLHIFTAERKEAFNRMILEQPAEIRGMFGSLPGGAVLQQYVDELEEQSGIIRNAAGGTDTAQAQILAAAMAEANGTRPAISEQDKADASRLAAQAAAEAAAKAAAAAQAQIAAQTAQLQQAMAQMQRSAAPAGAGSASTITTDASFAKEIASALKEAVTISDDNRRKDSEEMTKTLLASQKKLAEIMLMNAQVHQQAQAAQNSNNGGENTAPQTRTVFQPISSTLTADDSFAKEIASALKEAIEATNDNRKKESQELTRAIVDSQNKLAEIMVQNNSATLKAQNRLAQMLVQNNTANSATSSNNNANNIQINTAATFPPVEEMVSGIVKVQSELFKEMAQTQTKELSAIISLALKESQQLSTQSIITAIREMQKENLKFLQMHPAVYSAPAASPAPEPQSQPQPSVIEVAAESETNGSEQDDTDDFLSSLGGDVPQKKKKKKKKKKKSGDNLSLDGIASSLLDKVSTLTDKVSSLSGKKIFSGQDTEDDFLSENMSGNDLSDASPQIHSPSIDSSASDWGLTTFSEDNTAGETLPEETAADDSGDWIYTETPAEEAVDDALPEEAAADDSGDWIYTETPTEEAVDDALPEEAAADDSGNWVYTETPAEEAVDDALPEEEAAEDSGDWIYTETPAEEAVDDALPEEAAAEDSGDWIYTETPAEEAVDVSTTDTPSMEEPQTSWQWEYEATPEETSISAGNETSETPNTLSAENGEEEWEWDYEEVPEDDTSATAEMTDASAPTENDEDGWEYVELPEDDAGETTDGDWEYVEVPEEAAGEEEWEYVEIPEDEVEADADAISMSAETEADGGEEEWEWDYEEVPEDEVSTETDNDVLASESQDAISPHSQENPSFEESDPYRPDNQPESGDSEQTSLSTMYSGEVYFQDNVYNKPDEEKLPFDLPDNLTDGNGFRDLEDKDDTNEPYKPQDPI